MGLPSHDVCSVGSTPQHKLLQEQAQWRWGQPVDPQTEKSFCDDVNYAAHTAANVLAPFAVQMAILPSLNTPKSFWSTRA